MAELISNSHGLVAAGAGATGANAETVIATVELPASSEDWTIYGVWCQNVPATATAGESYGGHFRLRTPLGNLTPQPDPSRFPSAVHSSFLGAVADRTQAPLKIWPVNYKANGKADVELIFNEQGGVTVAEQVCIGILFGKSIPEPGRVMFIDRITATISAAAETQIGTFSLPQKVTKIVGLACVVAQDGVLTAGEESIGFWRVDSPDIQLDPMQLPINCAYGAGLGATIYAPSEPPVQLIPVDIPAVGGIDVNAFLDLNTALTNAAQVTAFIAYEL